MNKKETNIGMNASTKMRTTKHKMLDEELGF
jgi:hypothetical protein